MQLENSFTVPVPIDEAWRVLMDVERIAPCMPGAALDSVTGDDFTGRVKVKLGPINLTYQGKASFIERDEAAHKAVIDARGKDQRGNGTAAAIVTATLASEGSVTRVDVLTDLNITGRPAQFGRGVMTDVGNKLLGQFADRLSAQLASGDAGLDADVVDTAAAAQSQEPTVAGSASAAAAKVAATTAGVAEETAASLESGPEPVKKAAGAAKKAAAAAADSAASAESSAVSSPEGAPATPTKATPAKAAPAKATAAVPDPTVPPAKATTTPIGAAKKAPSQPPSGTTAPPNRPAGGGPAKSTPAAAPRQLNPVEPEPIDLLEVAGGAAFTRFAAPAAGAGVLLVLIALLLRRRNR
ncbi:SRPBCC family protein [Modestobacter versicolor]|uniref:SRPBCC family protein n=1 Tax=Modestobacter versicolor TaxID=429133 RepID=UPI0034DE990A